MASSQKKIILRRFRGDVLCGYLPASGIVEDGEISFLDLQGRLTSIAVAEIKTICYVRDFNLADVVNPERLQRRSFLSRPRGDGLWIRLTFKDTGDQLEGLTAALSPFSKRSPPTLACILCPRTLARTRKQSIFHAPLSRSCRCLA